ncbi:MAG TPA: hypothetical protein PLC16_08625 [Defluviitaleaceae bacterium]|nr:hypothetical protein [Defluviitaleaceae bacterium]
MFIYIDDIISYYISKRKEDVLINGRSQTENLKQAQKAIFY